MMEGGHFSAEEIARKNSFGNQERDAAVVPAGIQTSPAGKFNVL
jgi:hypothetical protein